MTMTSGAWPEVVWGAPVLRGLDARAKREIEAAGALRAIEAGERVFGAGEAADAFFVVASGACELRGGAGVVRRVMRGEAFGEEATVRSGATRAIEAVCTARATVAEIKAGVFRRAVARAGDAAVAERLERALLRAATADLLRASALGELVGGFDALLDAAVHKRLVRGDALFRAGDAAAHVHLVADGMVRLERATEDGERRLDVLAMVPRGAIVEDAIDASRACDAIADADTWIVAIPASAVPRDVLPRLREEARARDDAARALVRAGGARAIEELHRLEVAGSMLAIDLGACVRCGACASACAGAHEDGEPRLVRRGPVAALDAGDGSVARLLLVGSCQHCTTPACLVDCPTGAIARDARGKVVIRESLCIGCGACAKACPWGSIAMRDRGQRRLPIADARAPRAPVAQKCDLCDGQAGGPACVRACPADAIARLRPSREIEEVARALGRSPRAPVARTRVAAAPWLLAAIPVALGALLLDARVGARASGLLAGALFLALGAYPVGRRVALRRGARVRPHAVGHLALGIVGAAAAAGHALGHALRASAASALGLAFAGAVAAGALAAVAYRLVPPRLARLEKDGAPREDLAARVRAIDERLFRELTGRSAATKALWARLLGPYARRLAGPLFLLARGRTLDAEEARLRARIGEIALARMPGADVLLELAVERRALRARRWLETTMRALVPLHVALAGIALALLALHVFFALRSYR